MRVRCQRKSVINEQIIIETDSKKIEFIKLTADTDTILKLPLRGFFDFLENKLFILFKNQREQLTLVIEKDWIPFNDIWDVKYAKENETAFLLIKTGHSNFQCEYDTSTLNPIGSLWYSEDEEDANFGLWLSLIYNSTERKQIILENW